MQRSNHALCKQYQSFWNTIQNYGQAFLSSLADRAQRRSKVTRGGRLPRHTLRPVGRESGRGCGRARVGKLTVHTSALEIKCLTDTVRGPAWKKGARRCALQTAPYGDASARDGHGPMTARGMGLLEVLRAPLSHRTASICSLHEHCSGRQLEGAT